MWLRAVPERPRSHLISCNACVTAAISPYRATSDEVRAQIERFCEVYLECSIPVLTARDPKGLYEKALKGEKAYTVRPGSLLKAADLKATRKDAEEKVGRKLSELEFASYLMYPKVFSDFAAAQEQYGPVSVLPTPSYFYGMAVEDEILVDIEKGKTLVVRCLGIGDVDEKGMVTVFFELNGQPRRVKVPDRAHGALSGKARRKAEPGNDTHVAAPMPGVVSTLAVSQGQTVKAGDILLSIEAMKMETAMHAERDGTIAEVLVRTGDQIDAKDLLVVYG